MFVGGASVVARSFEAVETVRSVLQVLEQQYVMVSLVRDVISRGQSVAIGAEHGVEPLAACSVIVSPVVVDGEHVGTVGVLGRTIAYSVTGSGPDPVVMVHGFGGDHLGWLLVQPLRIAGCCSTGMSSP